MDIVDLTENKLEEASKLVLKVFPYERLGSYLPSDALKASLKPEEYRSFWVEYNLDKLQYFLLIDKNTGKVIGTTGFYSLKKDDPEVCWLGWFCIDTDYRGKKLGRFLLEWTIKKVQQEGFKVLKLYTSTHPNERAAKNLYDTLGFKVYQREQSDNDEYETLYRQLRIE